jgi:2-amino-4-hydroxy-6-hydroxymethyldihydropteridine diphosphokinase
MSAAVIGLGSNLGAKSKNLKAAVKALGLLPETKVTAQSSIYESPPEDMTDSQELYHNMAVVLETAMSPMALLGACLGIEAAMGRDRNSTDRIIDLDLLVYEGMKSESFELTLPHPRMLQRAFVLLPLKELYPSGRAPGLFFDGSLKEVDVSTCVKV